MTKLEQLEQTAKELLAEIEKMKNPIACNYVDNEQINLNNTWCEATEENYNALVDLGLRGSGLDKRFKYIVIEIDKSFHIDILSSEMDSQNKDYGKQIHLVNGKFEFVK